MVKTKNNGAFLLIAITVLCIISTIIGYYRPWGIYTFIAVPVAFVAGWGVGMLFFKPKAEEIAEAD